MKKIAFFVYPIKFFLSHRFPIAQKAIKEGYDVHLISTDSDRPDLLEEEGIHIHPIDITRSKANPFQEIRTIIQIYKVYRKVKPDIVHHITIKPVLYGTLVARLAGIKAVVNAFSGLGYVFTADGFKGTVLRTIILIAYKSILRHKNLISIVQNHDDLSYLQSKSIIKPGQTVLIKGSGVNLDEFKPTPEPNELPVIIMPARLLRDKGVMEFVDAAKILKKKDINVRMVLVGEVDAGNPSSVTSSEISSWTNRGIIEHWGYSVNMPATLAKSNIVCLPSYREGMPKSLIEACAAGRAIITTDVPGCREMIDKNNPNGIVVPPRNPEAIVYAIEDLIHNPKKRSIMAKNARILAEREFSIDCVVEKTIDIYRQLLTRNPPLD